MWCRFGHVTFKNLNQRNPRTPPSGKVGIRLPGNGESKLLHGTTREREIAFYAPRLSIIFPCKRQKVAATAHTKLTLICLPTARYARGWPDKVSQPPAWHTAGPLNHSGGTAELDQLDVNAEHSQDVCKGTRFLSRVSGA